MGLDMYLTKKTYVKNWDHEGPDARHTVTVTGPSASHIRPERISSIEEEVAYWRKANAIHQWFVDHCQNGIDECQQTYVGREKLLQLKALCEAVLTNRRDAPKLLPTASGFFFGSTDYDQYYFEDLESTLEIIDRCLALPTSWDFEYRSSW
mgnify:CR=1 FL=1